MAGLGEILPGLIGRRRQSRFCRGNVMMRSDLSGRFLLPVVLSMACNLRP